MSLFPPATRRWKHITCAFLTCQSKPYLCYFLLEMSQLCLLYTSLSKSKVLSGSRGSNSFPSREISPTTDTGINALSFASFCSPFPIKSMVKTVIITITTEKRIIHFRYKFIKTLVSFQTIRIFTFSPFYVKTVSHCGSSPVIYWLVFEARRVKTDILVIEGWLHSRNQYTYEKSLSVSILVLLT